MSEMIERVAKALAEIDFNEKAYGDVNYARKRYPHGAEDFAAAEWPRFQRPARAAIEAMREPTDAQIDKLSATNKLWRDLTSREVYQAFIDGALR